MSIRRRLAGSVLALMPVFFGACATVQPYEREYLTRPGMDTHGEALTAAFEAHVQSSREGAIGGHMTAESTGGGCGCN